MNISSYRSVLSILEVKESVGFLQLTPFLISCFFLILFSGDLSAQECPDFMIEYAIDVKWGVVEFYGWPEDISMKENTAINVIGPEGESVGTKWYGNNLLWIDWQHQDDIYDIEITYKNIFSGCKADTIYGVWYPFFDVEVLAGSGSGKKGQEVCLPVTAKTFLSINQFEFRYSWTMDSLNFNGIENINPLLKGALKTEMMDEVGGRQYLHVLTNSLWKDTVTIDGDEILFEMCFTPMICGPAEIAVLSEDGDKSPGFEVVGVSVSGNSSSGRIIVEDENNFDFELKQMCTSKNPDLFDYQLNIVDGFGPFTYSFDDQGIINGNFSGPDTTVVEIPVGNYQVSVETQCAEKSQSLSLASGEGVVEGDFQVMIDTLNFPNCEDQNGGEILVSVEPVSSDYHYLWVEENLEFEDGLLAGLPEGASTIEVRDSLNCKQTKEITLNINDDLLIDWSEKDTQLCPGQENAKVELDVSVPNYMISVDGGPIVENPEYIELSEGDHPLTVTTDAGCYKEETISVVQVEPYDPGTDLLEEIQVYEGDLVDVKITDPPSGSTIKWTTGGNEVGIESNLTWRPNSSGTLNLEVVYPPKCEYNKEVIIQLLEKEPFSEEFLPNAFTPNGDMINDVLRIPVTEMSFIDEVLQFDIFDRYGSLVFSEQTHNSGSSENFSWDGIIDGRLAAPDVYLARALLILSDGTKQSVEWSVQLIR